MCWKHVNFTAPCRDLINSRKADADVGPLEIREIIEAAQQMDEQNADRREPAEAPVEAAPMNLPEESELLPEEGGLPLDFDGRDADGNNFCSVFGAFPLGRSWDTCRALVRASRHATGNVSCPPTFFG